MSAQMEQQIDALQQQLTDTQSDYQNYAYAISHDLNAVFRQIQGFAELIQTSDAANLDDKTKQHFNLILQGCQNGQTILDALLKFSRLHVADTQFGPVKCDDLVNTVTNELAGSMRQRDAQITCDMLPELLGCGADIQPVFFHVLQNALLYHPDNTAIHVDISVSEHEAHWEFCVKDNGIGMSERAIETAFIPLRRAVSPKRYAGIGMGLTIAKSLLQFHQSNIWLESEKGVGTCAYFTLAKNAQQ